MEFKAGDLVVFRRNNVPATVLETKTTGQPYKLGFADGGAIWTSASMIKAEVKNPWLLRKHERVERPPIRIDFGDINIPSIIGGHTIPSNITWDFNIPSVIVLTGLDIPSVITFSGTGDA